MNDLISRQALCEYALNQKDKSVTPNDIMRFPSAESNIITLTPEEIAREISTVSLYSAYEWYNVVVQLYEMGFVVMQKEEKVK